MLKMKKREAVKKWRVPSDLAAVRKASAQALAFFKPLGLSDAYRFDIRLCFEEALINSMKHGNGLKKSVPVDIEAGYDDKKIWLRFEDHGNGFNVSSIKDCTQDDGLLKGGGRGVYLVHQLMDEVKYNAKGNVITMVKSIQGPQ